MVLERGLSCRVVLPGLVLSLLVLVGVWEWCLPRQLAQEPVGALSDVLPMGASPTPDVCAA